MLKLKILITLMIVCLLSVAQQIDTIPSGYTASRYDSLTNSTIEFVKSSGGKLVSKGGYIAANNEYIVEPNSDLDTIASFSLNVGDKLSFKCGGVWEGSISTYIRDSISIGCTGSGDLPIIYGSEILTGWVQLDDTTWSLKVGEIYNQIFKDDYRMQFASYPEIGYMTIDSIISNQSIYSDELEGVNWVGAHVFTKILPWSCETSYIDVSNDGVIHWVDDLITDYGMVVGDQFRILNSRQHLNSVNEFTIDLSDSTIYIHMLSGDSPVNYEFRASVYDNFISGSGLKKLTIQDLDIRQFKRNAIELTGANEKIKIRSCKLADNYDCGINIFNSSNDYIVIANNVITGHNRDNIRGQGNNFQIYNNRIEKTALLRNIGLDAMIDVTNVACGVLLYPTTNSFVKNNLVDSTGYNGIHFYGTGNTVKNNIVKDFCVDWEDGGAIYAHQVCTDSKIESNICFNTDMAGNGVNGIYIDGITTGISVLNNTSYHSNLGMHCNNLINCTISGNTLFDNGTHQLSLREHDEAANGATNTISNNIMFTADTWPTKSMLAWAKHFEDTYWNFSNNLHCFTTQYPIYYYESREGSETQTFDTDVSISEWDTYTGQTTGSSQPVGWSTSDYQNARKFVNMNWHTVTYYLNGATNVEDVQGVGISNLFILQPYSSRIIKGTDLNLISTTQQ